MNILDKYNDNKNLTKLPTNNMTSAIDKRIFNDKNVSIDEIGLYIYLAFISGRVGEYNGKRVATNYKALDLYKRIYKPKGLSGSYRKTVDNIEKMLQHLEKLGYINRFTSMGYPIIAMSEINDLQPFALINVVNAKIITSGTSGRQTLRLLATYAAIRSRVFEKRYTGEKVFDMPLGHVANYVNSDPRTVNRYLQWLRTNYVLAYFKVVLPKVDRPIRCIYSDIYDYKTLRETVEYRLRKGYVKRVVE